MLVAMLPLLLLIGRGGFLRRLEIRGFGMRTWRELVRVLRRRRMLVGISLRPGLALMLLSKCIKADVPLASQPMTLLD